jgi:DNA-binding MarR family transcriptional regulator
MQDLRQRELTEEALELLPKLVRLFKSSLCVPAEVSAVPFGQVRVILFLYQHGRSTVGQAAAGIGVSLATASELVDRLVDDGWIERSANPADRRQVLISLTDKAVAISDVVYDMRRAQMASAFDRLATEDRPAFVRGLRALVDALEESVDAQTAATAADCQRPNQEG